MREDTLLIVLTFALGAVLAQVSLCALAGTLAPAGPWRMQAPTLGRAAR